MKFKIFIFLMALCLLIVPASANPIDPVTSLGVKEKSSDSITWEWTDPATNYTTTNVWIDGIEIGNTTSGQYTASGLDYSIISGSSHTISLRVWSDNESSYSTWANNTASTYSSFGWMGTIIEGAASLFSGFLTLITNAVPILIILAVVGFIIGFFDKILGAIESATRMFR